MYNLQIMPNRALVNNPSMPNKTRIFSVGSNLEIHFPYTYTFEGRYDQKEQPIIKNDLDIVNYLKRKEMFNILELYNLDLIKFVIVRYQYLNRKDGYSSRKLIKASHGFINKNKIDGFVAHFKQSIVSLSNYIDIDFVFRRLRYKKLSSTERKKYKILYEMHSAGPRNMIQILEKIDFKIMKFIDIHSLKGYATQLYYIRNPIVSYFDQVFTKEIIKKKLELIQENIKSGVSDAYFPLCSKSYFAEYWTEGIYEFMNFLKETFSEKVAKSEEEYDNSLNDYVKHLLKTDPQVHMDRLKSMRKSSSHRLNQQPSYKPIRRKRKDGVIQTYHERVK
jgi:hypothetical protein